MKQYNACRMPLSFKGSLIGTGRVWGLGFRVWQLQGPKQLLMKRFSSVTLKEIHKYLEVPPSEG